MNIHARMDPSDDVVSKLTCQNGSEPCIFFDRSKDVITTFFPNPETQCSESDDGFKKIGLDALEEAKDSRNSGIIIEIVKVNGSIDDDVSCDNEDYEMKSDAATSPHNLFIDNEECDVEDYETNSDAAGTSPRHSIDNVDDLSDDECDVDGMLCDENVKNKLELLARMVGIHDCSNPGIVLAEVVTILKELESKKTC